ncbi:acylphosphatase [Erythrobacter sp. 3-20A1M]|uniref:acylphosphatase n=1 Tax=Erythrobacter sp. 3-20A1M TaxID=2653850 RepID=UPI001BFC6C44|nr:acylphosphatase [Erythrobacter sp. 3-20A1M]QWC57607.1 acylphosphatase [Erythrobacter sp. 3-20A1M]
MTARRVILHGRVQGVFYRDWTVETARGLDLVGWVRNRSDGTVEAHLEGERDAIRRMIEAMHAGPPRANVDRIEESAADEEGLATFERR